MSGGTKVPRSFPPISPEDLAKLGVDAQLIPMIVSTVLRAEQSPDDSPPLSAVEAENLVDIIDKVISSSKVNPSQKNRCFRVLRKVSPTHGVLPRSYFVPGVTLSDTIAYASGGFADVWKGQQDGNQLCVKAFRTQTPGNLDKIKRRFYREIVGWKYVLHPNVVPFLGVSASPFSFCIITPWLQNGNIVEYTQEHLEANRLQLLAQSACGLEYLHSLGIVHSDVHPGNILITEEGDARLGDFGITGVITDPTAVEPGATTTLKPGVVRYMAPELLNPSQFNLANGNASTESDIYSLAMTAYEVLTGILPYGHNRDGIIIFHVATGERPNRPSNAQWLQDDIWTMIRTCWSERREQRWNIRAVYDLFSTSSIQEASDAGPDLQITLTPNAISAASPDGLSLAPFVKLEESSPPVQREARTNLFKRDKKPRSQAAPIPNILRRSANLTRSGSNTSELRTNSGVQGEQTQKPAKLLRGLGRLRAVVDILKGFLRSWEFPVTDRRSSR